MQTQQFLELVLSGEGYYCVFGAHAETKKKIQKFYPTIEAAHAVAENFAREGYDAYFALATFETGESRKVENTKQLKSFFLDIDCGPSKDYPNQEMGIAALREFCKSARLPRPTMVNSGRGVHVYWALTEAISTEAWVPVAEALKALCKLHDMRSDVSVTADAARILRVPGTYNFKDTPPNDVAILGDLGKPVEFAGFKTLMGAVSVTAKNFVPKVMDDVTNALAGNYSNSFRLILEKTAAGRGCAQLAKVIQEQATISEPMWRAGLSVAKFCLDSAKAIHKISSKHPDYNADETEEKAATIRGPYTCAKFDEYSPNVCADCKHRGKFKSPIVLGRVIQEATEEDNIVQDVPELDVTVAKQTYIIPKYPEPYFRGKAGGVFKRSKNKEGDPIEIPIYHNDLYVVRRLNDFEVGEAVVMRLHLPKDGVREFTIPLTAILSKDEFRKYTGSKGVTVIKMEELMSYTTAWVNKLQASQVADEARRQFGWTDDIKFESFVVGNKEIRADRVDQNPPSTSTVRQFPALQSKGTIAGWRDIMEFYNRDGMELHQYVIGLSLGSPFMALVPQCASLFHIYSKDPGLGKTTAMLAGASIWGNPELILLREADTHASKMGRAEVMKNIFLPIDEMTNVHPKEASDFLYQLTGGMQRNRQSSSANIERIRGETWHLNACSTGNTGLLSRIRMYKAIPKAEATRVLEHEAKKYHFETKAETDDLSRNLYQHYGHACVPYMQYIIQNWEECKALFLQTQERIDLAAGLSQPHRYWSVQAASAITGLLVAKKIGLVNFKVSAVVQWIVDVMKQAKADIETMGGTMEDMLTGYLAENYNNILRIKSTDDSRAMDQLDHIIIPDASPRMTLVARYEYDVKRMYLLPKPLREWCAKQQIDYQSFVNNLRSGNTRAMSKKVRMGKGTNMNLPPADVWVLDCSEFMNDDVEQTIAAATVADAISQQNS